MCRNCSKGAKTPRFRRGTEPPRPIGVEVIGKKDVAFHTCRECCTPTRPCEVNGEPALFHGWVMDETEVLNYSMFVQPGDQRVIRRRFDLEHVLPAGVTLEKLQKVVALIETQDGLVGKVDPGLVRFTDRKEV